MKIVGTGCGPGMLTLEAIKTIEDATIIYGSKRAIELAHEFISQTADVQIIKNYSELKDLPDYALILSTGDPMISGLGYLPGTVIPGISSVQYASSLLHLQMTDMVILTAHGRSTEPILADAKNLLNLGKKICLITDPLFSMEKLQMMLKTLQISVRISICENLGYPDERIVTGNLKNLPRPVGNLYILLIEPEK